MKKAWKQEELLKILEENFLLNPSAFEVSRMKEDVQDSMCICHCLEREWTELFAKWVDNFDIPERYIFEILCYYEDLKNNFVTNELHGKARWGRVGTTDAMDYTINY